MKAVIILPTYNERENITLMLTSLVGIVKKIQGYTFAILVVDDNSPDGTQQEVATFQKTHKEVYCITGKKEGLGRALLRGMEYAVRKLHADVIAQMDADLSHDPESLPALFAKIRDGADFVVGSRYIQGGSIPQNWGIHRKIYSVVGNAFVRYGLGYPKIHDWTGGYRVFRTKFYEEAKDQIAKYSGYVFQIAFLNASIVNGATVAEVPIRFTDRRFGRSKIAPLEYIFNIYAYVIRARIKRTLESQFFRFAVVGTIGFVINTVILELLVKQRVHPAIGSALGAECAIISNFFLNNTWTFRHRKISGGNMIPKFFQFNLASVGAIFIQAGTVFIGTYLFGESLYRWYYLLGVGIGLFWNYTMYSKVIWKHQKS